MLLMVLLWFKYTFCEDDNVNGRSSTSWLLWDVLLSVRYRGEKKWTCCNTKITNTTQLNVETTGRRLRRRRRRSSCCLTLEPPFILELWSFWGVDS